MPTVPEIQDAIKNAESAGNKQAVDALTRMLNREIAAGTGRGGMSWGDVAYNAAKNVIPSAGKLVGDYAQALLHPIDTAKAVADVGAGAIRAGAAQVLPESVMSTLDNLGGAGENSQRAADAATAVGRFYGDRYGSMEGFKRSIAEDPVGVAADVSVPLTLGGAAAARAPGVAGRVGAITRAAGEALDPVMLAAKGAGGAGKLARGWVGTMTGAGDEPLREAFNATRAGGKRSAAYYDNMRGKVQPDAVISEATGAMDNLSRQRAADYQAGIQSTKTSTAKVNLKNVADQLLNAIDGMEVQGLWTGGPASKRTAERVMNDLISWAKTPGSVTPIGLDGLKKRINSYFVTPGPSVSTDRLQANRLVELVRDALDNEIKRADPNYAATMKNYAEASDQLRELRGTFSLHDRAASDTTLRKLQSTMRNDVQTNYGKRTSLARELEAAGADTLMPSLAGQALSSWAPRGVARAGAAAAGVTALPYFLQNPMVMGAGLANAALTSPRLMGEAAGLLGKGAGVADKVTAKIPKAMRGNARASLTPARRAITQETGGIANEEDTMLIDAKGNVYDKKGRLIRRAGE